MFTRDRKWRQLFVYLLDVVQGVNFRRQAPVDTEELLVHQGGQWQTVEGFHASVVNTLGVFYFALLLEGEIFREVAALVIPPQEEQGCGIDQLQGPQINNTLQM